MGETEVTQGQWAAVMSNNPSHFKDVEWKKLPVESVSWNDALEFIKKLNAQSPTSAGWKWALPTEAQWERACRGGTTTATAFGDSLSSHQANFDGNHPYVGAAKGPNLEKTAPVKSYEPNAYGLYDTHGNVREWCADAYHESLPGGVDPLVTTDWNRVIRGGGWNSRGYECRSSRRSRNAPDSLFINGGFRLAAVPSP
jgi:formylglycine-generating enzyme required for sulfatase activity